MFLAARGVTATSASDGPGLGHAGLIDREDGCAGIGQPALSELLQPAVATRINLPVMVVGATEVFAVDQRAILGHIPHGVHCHHRPSCAVDDQDLPGHQDIQDFG